MNTKKPAAKSSKKRPVKSKGTKTLKKTVKVTKVVQPLWPVEVVIEDSVQHALAFAEYRHEWKWWFGAKLFKVYHPAFKELPDNSRWVLNLGKILGPIPPERRSNVIDVVAEVLNPTVEVANG